MDALSRKSVLVYDLSGSYTHIAERLIPDFAKVYYHTQWERGFSEVMDYLPGDGIEGLERIADPADIFDDIDLAVFPDVGQDGLQEYLRRQGILVWGSGVYGELERDRLALKRSLQRSRMDVADFEVIQGLTALDEYLQKAPECWIKISYFRGLTETYHHLGEYFLSEEWLNHLRVKLGPYKEEVQFLVEQPIEGDEAIEVGVDAYLVDGALPSRVLWGYEDKDAGFVGTTLRLPERLNQVTGQFITDLDGYRGPMSTEVRMTKDKDYMVDFTARFPSPPSEAQIFNTRNFSETIYAGAQGEMVQPDFANDYVAEFVMSSDILGEGEPLALMIGVSELTAIHGHVRNDGHDYAVSPQKIKEFAGAVGMGNSLADAIEEALEVAQAIKGAGVKFDQDALKRIMETIEKGEALGLRWGVK